MRVLLLIADPTHLEHARLILMEDKINHVVAQDSDDARHLCQDSDFDVAVTSNVSLVGKLRMDRTDLPLMLLHDGAMGIEDKIKAYDAGCDMLMEIPMPSTLFISAVRMLAAKKRGLTGSFLSFGDLKINISEKCVSYQGNNIYLTGKEYRMVEALAMRKGAVMSKDMLLDALYGDKPDEPEVKIIDVFVCKVRKKFAAATGGKPFIETSWGRGYRLNPNASADYINPRGAGLAPMPELEGVA